MDCYKFNEETYKKIENFLEGQKKEESVLEPTFYKSIYSPATLINDWADKRTIEKKKDGSSEPPITEQMDQFRKPCKSQYPDRQECFNKVFESYGLGQELLMDHLGYSYYNNYVTSYDLCYNHLTKGICGPFPRRFFRGKCQPEKDLTLIYGNLTQWGLKEKIEREKKNVVIREAPPVSETSDEFRAYNIACVRKLNDFQSFNRVRLIT